MIRHVVLVKFRADVPAAERQASYAGLAALEHKVPGVLGMHFGPNVNPEGMAKGFDDGFIMDFVDAAARDAYLVHPDHKAAGAGLLALLEGGADGVVVFDLDID